MVKTIIYCDRCGKECEKDRNNHGYQIILARVNDNSDLCQKCYDELYDWMNYVKMKETQSELSTDNDDTCQEGLYCPMDIVALPSVNPVKRRVGEWLKLKDKIEETEGISYYTYYMCSECFGAVREITEFNYCPKCGVRMREVKE